MAEPVRVVSAAGRPTDSPARTRPPTRPPLRVAAVQHRWHPDPDEHRDALAGCARTAAALGARLVCFPELTLSPYPATSVGGPGTPGAPDVRPEPLPGGATHRFAAELAAELGVVVHASLFEQPGSGDADSPQPGFNTAICVDPAGDLVARTRKVHIPVTAGYHEDRWFRPGDTRYPVATVEGAAFGFPTCWDEWFPEVARLYSLAGAEVIVYPTAIGSEPDHPDFDTQPLWETVIRANGIANGTFMVVPNRIGTEGPVTFYGSSFISDPYGRVLVHAPRDEPAVLVADLDLEQRRDWLELFPFLATRRPDTYGPLVGDGD